MQTVTLQVPEALYQRLQRRAAETHRTVEAAVLDVLAGAVPLADDLPADLASALSPLSVLDDEALWQAARSRLPDETVTALEHLHLKQGHEGLSDTERHALAELVRQYERSMLVRAQAAALLRQRGHDVSGLLGPP